MLNASASFSPARASRPTRNSGNEALIAPGNSVKNLTILDSHPHRISPNPQIFFIMAMMISRHLIMASIYIRNAPPRRSTTFPMISLTSGDTISHFALIAPQAWPIPPFTSSRNAFRSSPTGELTNLSQAFWR